MKKLMVIGGLLIAALAFAGCGGSSGSGTAGGGGTTTTGDNGGAGEASVKSLSALPTADLSSYDSSTSSSSSSVAAVPSIAVPSVSVGGKVFGDKAREVGNSSRVGCEANMHKKQIFRDSQMAQLDRCYPEAMEKVGLITIPTGSSAYYQVTPPEMSSEEKTRMCQGIPAERTEEKRACQQGGEGHDGKAMQFRIGRFDNELRVDMCQAGTLTNEATYSASGSVYTAGVIRIGNWGGHNEKSTFSMTVDLGTTGVVDDGVVTLGTDGLASATGQMNGGFGNGTITFERTGAGVNTIKGGFTGGFTDPFSGTTTSFAGKTFSKFNATGGCGKFSFTGSMPAMRVSDMIPFNIGPGQQQAQFLQAMGAQMGISNLATTSKLCPNPNFNPESPDPTIKPMVILTGDNCGSVTHTGTECYVITNGTSRSAMGGTQVSQTFTRVANTDSRVSAFLDAVTGFDLATLNATAGTIVFSRNWDCKGTFSTIDFTGVNQTTMETAMNACKTLEEKGRMNNGMGEYDCGKKEQDNNVKDLADKGGGADTFGVFGGEYAKTSNGTCPANIPEKVFANVIDAGANRYCFPRDGSCAEFTISGTNAVISGAGIDMGGGIKITAIAFNSSTAPTSGSVTLSIPNVGNCTATYGVSRPQFTTGGNFGGAGGGTRPGDAGFVPQPCIERGWNTPDKQQACYEFCGKPENQTSCRPTS